MPGCKKWREIHSQSWEEWGGNSHVKNSSLHSHISPTPTKPPARQVTKYSVSREPVFCSYSYPGRSRRGFSRWRLVQRHPGLRLFILLAQLTSRLLFRASQQTLLESGSEPKTKITNNTRRTYWAVVRLAYKSSSEIERDRELERARSAGAYSQPEPETRSERLWESLSSRFPWEITVVRKTYWHLSVSSLDKTFPWSKDERNVKNNNLPHCSEINSRK